MLVIFDLAGWVLSDLGAVCGLLGGNWVGEGLFVEIRARSVQDCGGSDGRSGCGGCFVRGWGVLLVDWCNFSLRDK